VRIFALSVTYTWLFECLFLSSDGVPRAEMCSSVWRRCELGAISRHTSNIFPIEPLRHLGVARSGKNRSSKSRINTWLSPRAMETDESGCRFGDKGHDLVNPFMRLTGREEETRASEVEAACPRGGLRRLVSSLRRASLIAARISAS